jgi:hypothetical protein
MKVQSLRREQIVMDQPNPDHRTFSRAFCESLAENMEQVGVLQDPIVRPIPGQPDRFRLIAGMHRVYSWFQILKRPEMNCKIAPDSMTDDEARAVEISENLMRNPLTDVQSQKALVDLKRIYDSKNPDGTRATNVAIEYDVRRKVEEAEAESGKELSEQEKEQIREEVIEANPKPKSFPKLIQDMSNGEISLRTAQRLTKRASHLDHDHFNLLAKHDVKEATYDKLADLEDKAAIDTAVKLIVSGTDHEEALRVANKVKEKAAKKPGSTVKPPRKKLATEVDMTDEEWLGQFCGGILKLLSGPGRKRSAFSKDAILYRRTADAIVRLRVSVKKALAEAKDTNGGNGHFFNRLNGLVNAKHPSDWEVCFKCKGAGQVPGQDTNGKDIMVACTACVGGGYRLKVDSK